MGGQTARVRPCPQERIGRRSGDTGINKWNETAQADITDHALRISHIDMRICHIHHPVPLPAREALPDRACRGALRTLFDPPLPVRRHVTVRNAVHVQAQAHHRNITLRHIQEDPVGNSPCGAMPAPRPCGGHRSPGTRGVGFQEVSPAQHAPDFITARRMQRIACSSRIGIIMRLRRNIRYGATTLSPKS